MTMAQQVLAGEILYQDAVDNRSPFVPYAKALIFWLFGDWNAEAVHISLAAALGASGALLGWIGYRLGGKTAGATAALLFVVLQFAYVDPQDSMCTHTEWFVLIFSTIAFALFVRTQEQPSFAKGLPIGLFFSLSMLSKQPGVLDFFVASIVVAFLIFLRKSERKQLGFWWLGMFVALLIPFGLVSYYFYWHGAFADYLYYTFTFNTSLYVPEIPLEQRLLSVTKPFEMAWRHVPAISVVTLVGFLYWVPTVIKRTIHPPKTYPLLALLALGWTCSGLVSATLGGRGFAHYSATMIPGICLICAACAQALAGQKNPTARITTSSAIAAFALVVTFQFAKHYPTIAGALNSQDRSLEDHGEIVQRLTDKNETILIWGYFPEIYFHAQRRPANRFIYTNYLTGMIPWTNVDPLRDTAYAIVPDAKAKFAQDFAERPPALIVDSQMGREYDKYPIAQQRFLWSQIVASYAQVEVKETKSTGMRFFRRLDQPKNDSNSEMAWPIIPELAIIGVASMLENEPTQIEVRGPQGADQLELVVNNRVVSSLRYRVETPIDVRFFIPGNHFAANNVYVRAIGPDIRGRSAAINLSKFAREQRATPPQGPMLNFGTVQFQPEHVFTISDATSRYSDLKGAWELQAPARIEYACPTGVTQIKFSHGMHPIHIHDSDGYDLVLNWIPNHGEKRRLWIKRNTHGSSGIFQEIQHETVTLPSREAGKLEFQFSTGANGNHHQDFLFLGPIEAKADLPYLKMGNTILIAKQAHGPTNEPPTQAAPERWIAHVPTEMRWDRPHLLKTFSFEFGIDERAYDIESGNRTDGVQFKLEFQSETEGSITLFDRTLNPLSQPEDRGAQRAEVLVPANLKGQIIFTTLPGAADNPAWDWAWVGNFTAATPAPPITLNNGKILPMENITAHPSMWAKRDRRDKWSAHPPQQITYHKPANLQEIVINFGLFDVAIQDEDGNRRSDGIVAKVSFASNSSETQELFRKVIDPFVNPSEAGNQRAVIPFPLGEVGKVILEMEAGAHDSFDWAYWGEMSGKIWGAQLN